MIITNLGEYFKESLVDINQIIERNNYDEILDYIGEGFSSTVYGYDDFAVKLFNKNYGSFRFRDEDYKFLNILKESEFFPNLYAYEEKSFIVVDYIEGYLLTEIDTAINNNYFSKEVLSELDIKVSNQFNEIFNFCKSKNILPFDLHGDNVIINEKGDICVIDVGYFKEYSLEKNAPNYLTERQINVHFEDCYEYVFEIESIINEILTKSLAS